MRKWLVMLTALVLVLAACSSSDSETTTTSGESATTTAAPSGDVTEVLVWHMEQPPHRVARIQELMDEFNAANPDIVVKQEPQNWGEIYAKAPAAVKAGNGPALLFAIPDFTPILRAVGGVQDVTDFVAELDGSHGFNQATVAPYAYDGGTWAVPLYNMALSMWFRNSVFEEAGVTPPTTWDEWLAATEKLTTGDQYGLGLPANKQLYTDQTVYSMMVNAGASEIYNPDGTIRFDTPETVEAYDFYSQLYKYTAPDAPTWTWGEAEACFANRSCASILQFTVITTYDTQAEGDADDLGVIAIPHKDGIADPGTIAYPNGVMFMSDDPAVRAASEKFISFLLEPENYGRFLNMEPGLFLPVTEDGATASSFWDDATTTKYRSQVETMIENSKSGRLFGFTNGNTFPSIASISAQNLIAETIQEVVINGQTPADAVAATQKKMEEATK